MARSLAFVRMVTLARAEAHWQLIIWRQAHPHLSRAPGAEDAVEKVKASKSHAYVPYKDEPEPKSMM